MFAVLVACGITIYFNIATAKQPSVVVHAADKSTEAAKPVSAAPQVKPVEPPPPPPPKPLTADIVNDSSLVLPGGYLKPYSFHVGKSGDVTGRFSAKGGVDDAITVVITNADGYTNMSHNNTFRAWYNSGELTVDDIAVRNLPPGDYLLVFSTRRSLTNRTIETRVTLTDCCY